MKYKIKKYHKEKLENIKIESITEYEKAERTSYIYEIMEKLEICWQSEMITDTNYNKIMKILSKEINEEINKETKKEAEETN